MDRWDAITFIGGAVVVLGIAVIYWPAAMMVAGVVLIAAGIVGARAQSRPVKRHDAMQGKQDTTTG